MIRKKYNQWLLAFLGIICFLKIVKAQARSPHHPTENPNAENIPAHRNEDTGSMRLPLYNPHAIPGQGRPRSNGASQYGNRPYTKQKAILPELDISGHHLNDEICSAHCQLGEYECQTSCTCIPIEKRCDEIKDCAPADDEEHCSTQCEKDESRTTCPFTKVCIQKQWLCDGDDDCGDFSDETNCAGALNCTSDQFTCKNGLCIFKNWECDGENDCKDGSDEINCSKNECSPSEFQCLSGQCISLHWKCDKEIDCIDESDEYHCPPDVYQCTEDMFQCKNKRCVRKSFQCDGDNDCLDWSDEVGCTISPNKCNFGEFRCGDGKCIPAIWYCDREEDCADKSDEQGCLPDQQRTCASDEYTCNDQRCILKSWLCDGIADCTTGEDEKNCETKCEMDQYACKNATNTKSSAFGMCLSRKHVCDGMADCPNGDDELDCPTFHACDADSKCEKLCITTSDHKEGCACPIGYKLADDGHSCDDIDECMYSQNPVCSQTCSNMPGSFICGCMTGYILRPDLRSCKATKIAPTLLFTNRVEIRQVELVNERYTSIIKGLHNAVALDYHYKKKLIFWCENTLNVIRMARIGSSNGTDIIRWGLESPSGVAVDWIHDLLFWTDSGTRRVEVGTLDGRQRAVIAASDLDKPRAVAIHPGDALVFWTDWGPSPKIERADMDGSKRKTVIADSIFWPNGLTIDYTSSRLYWADAKHHVIECANFDGRERKKVANKGLPHPFGLTIFEDAVYWTDWHTNGISTVNKKTGAGLQKIYEGVRMPMDIHSYHPLRQPTYDNHCSTNNGGCSHLCLPNSHSYSCHCPLGYDLHSDKRTCDETPEKLMLFARKKDIRLKHLFTKKQSDSIDMVIPIENIKAAMALAWDQNTNSIFWSDIEKESINRAYLNGTNQRVIVGSNLLAPSGLSYDWIGDKLYWTDADTKRIEASSSDGSMRTVLAWENIEKPTDIVVEPNSGLMYWSDWGETPCIERSYMDGSNRERLISGNMTRPNGLSIDLASKRIYWADGGRKSIEYAKLDGTGRTTLIGQNLPHPFSLDVHGDEVIWIDGVSLQIQAVNKNTGVGRKTLAGGIVDLMAVKVFHKERKRRFNRCENSGCSHLCLLKPGGYSCACPIGITMEDSKTCAKKPSSYLLFAHRVVIRTISLDMPYLIDVVLPISSLKNVLSVDIDRKTDILYWTDTAQRKIQRSKPPEHVIETIVSYGINSSDGISIDSAGRKIYWTDAGRNSIEVAELDGSNRKILIWKNLDSPRGLALHYPKGIMFWSDWGTKPKIERADMDGRNRKTIIDHKISWPNGIAIDFKQDRIYWCDAKENTISSGDFEGHNILILLTKVQYPYGIAVYDKYIYWTDWKTKALHRAKKLDGNDAEMIRENLEGLMDIKVIAESENAYYLSESRCTKNNGGCSHLCLRSPKGYSCACPTGLTFEEGSNSRCKKHPDEFLVFASGNGISMISFDAPERADVLLPIKGVENAIAVDFHWEKQLLFYTDVALDVIKSVNLNDMSETNVIVSKNLKTPNGLAVDWVANNIYWTDNDRKQLEIAKIDGSCRKVLISSLVEPRSLALFPRKGYLFWTDWGDTPKIERSMLDGSRRKIIIQKELGFPNGLTIDYKAKRLYWTDSLKNKIETSTLDGENIVRLIPGAKHPYGLTQFGDAIYWSDWYYKSIRYANKITGGNITTVKTDLEMAMEIKAVSESKQPGTNPCKVNNGHCSHLCLFHGDGYICACPDEPDQRECSTKPSERVPLTKDLEDNEGETFISTDIHPGSTSATAFLLYTAFGIITVLVSIVATYVIARRCVTRPVILKEDFRSANGRHISFPNPNYNGTQGIELVDRRPNRFNLFKYDRAQERVTNLYVAEGAQLLPAPIPSRTNSEDFHTVTLHPIT